MKKKVNIFILTSFLILIIVFFMTQSPDTVGSDFDYEYNIATNKIEYFEGRNKNVDTKEFTFNDMFFCDELNESRLIIHSLDIIDKVEKIVFVKENENTRSAFVDYMNFDGTLLNFEIQYFDHDSIEVKFITETNKGYVFFRGCLCSIPHRPRL